ncbi:hypothetical protein H9X71_08330 [Clavibacter zhangzhiyongii]|uniref:Uncharacterized protein n=1 Tax=Clavibacter zhangzhiyongii TaxID=2768071 RepID=A0A7L7YYZ0_9MICO|nr:hypothetical protein H9X71_08330 [Clavibacter zhangzhiyongii]
MPCSLICAAMPARRSVLSYFTSPAVRSALARALVTGRIHLGVGLRGLLRGVRVMAGLCVGAVELDLCAGVAGEFTKLSRVLRGSAEGDSLLVVLAGLELERIGLVDAGLVQVAVGVVVGAGGGADPLV